MRHGLYVLLGVLLVPTVGLVGDVVTDGRLTSTMPTGAPLQVASNDMVANLNADMVDGVEGTNIYTKAEVDALVAAASASDSRRWYYKTPDSAYTGADALTACDTGFHMASIYEILDVSNLRYDTGRGLTKDDSGQGPPQVSDGWVRTGQYSYTGNAPGVSNCSSWTSSSPSHYGTVVYLRQDWFDGQGFWTAITLTCDTTRNVWCVQD